MNEKEIPYDYGAFMQVNGEGKEVIQTNLKKARLSDCHIGPIHVIDQRQMVFNVFLLNRLFQSNIQEKLNDNHFIESIQSIFVFCLGSKSNI